MNKTSRLIESQLEEKSVCPFGGHEKVNRWGVVAGLQRYRYVHCKNTFNALTCTPLAHLRHKHKWMTYAEQTAACRSVRKGATECQAHLNTAFRWRHRFLKLPHGQHATLLNGMAKADETVFLKSFIGRKDELPRSPPRQRGGKATTRDLYEEQIPVLICVDRTGNTVNFVVEKADQRHLSTMLKSLLPADTILYTDNGKTLGAFGRELGAVHRPINLTTGIRVVAGVYHIQNMNDYSRGAKAKDGALSLCRSNYLGNYLGWRRLIEHHHDLRSPKNILHAALRIYDQQLTAT